MDGSVLPNASAKEQATLVTEKGSYLFQHKQYQEAKKVLKRALILQSLFNNADAISQVSYQLGISYLKLASGDEITENKQPKYSEKSKNFLRSARDHELSFKSEIYTNTYFALGHLKLALEYASFIPEDKKVLMDAYASLGAIYLRLSKAENCKKPEKYLEKSKRFFNSAREIKNEIFDSTQTTAGLN